MKVWGGEGTGDSGMSDAEDFPVHPKSVHGLWQARKMGHEDARRELIKTRARGIEGAIRTISLVEEHERMVAEEAWRAEVEAELRQRMRPWRSFRIVEDWKAQFAPEVAKTLFRFKLLLLRGRTRAGKSLFSSEIFGAERTLILHCQAGTTALPQLKGFSRAKHQAIVLDEASPAHVLANRAVLQSTSKGAQLGQSQCGQHEYTVWLHGIAWILTSNEFPFEGEWGSEDTSWLRENICVLELGPNEKYYME